MTGSWPNDRRAAGFDDDLGPGLVWRPVDRTEWTGSADGELRADVHQEESTGRWVATIQLEDPPGGSPMTTLGHYDTAEQAQASADDAWTAHTTAHNAFR